MLLRSELRSPGMLHLEAHRPIGLGAALPTKVEELVARRVRELSIVLGVGVLDLDKLED